MSNTRALCAVLSLTGLLVSCRLSKAEYETIDAWLLCDECVGHEREAVRAIGGAAIHTLDQALVGPSPGRVANKEAQFKQMYRTMSPAPAVPETTYVRELRSNYIAKYQYRAAVSLGDIGGRRALAALQRALDSAAVREYRPDVVKAIDVVLALASAPRPSGPVTGLIGTTTPRFGDTVRLVRTASQSWTGNETVTLHGSAFADSLLVRRWALDSLAFLAIGSLGDYAVALAWFGQPAGRQVIPLQIVPPGYGSHTSATAPLITADSVGVTRYMLLPTRPGDTTDFFRLEPTESLTVTAAVTSSGVTPATLRWYTCAPLSLLTTPTATVNVIGAVVDERGEPIGNAQVTPIGMAVSTTTDSAGRFMLVGVPASPLPRLRAQKIDFRPSVTTVQLVADRIQLGITRTTVSEATALSRHASTLSIPAGACRMLQILVPSTGGQRTLRLRVTSP